MSKNFAIALNNGQQRAPPKMVGMGILAKINEPTSKYLQKCNLVQKTRV
jgi:hypothetical protein